MFTRIKNLLELSKYTVEEIKAKEIVFTPTVSLKKTSSSKDIIYTTSNLSSSSPALIIDMKKFNPLNEFENDTTQ